MRYTEEQIDRLIVNSLEGADGHTEYAFDDESVAARYVVGGAGTIMLLTPRILYYSPERSRKSIHEWVSENPSAETLGFWVDNDRVYFDAGDTYGYLGQALSVARQRGELAIWDRVENCEIRVDTAPVLA